MKWITRLVVYNRVVQRRGTAAVLHPPRQWQILSWGCCTRQSSKEGMSPAQECHLLPVGASIYDHYNLLPYSLITHITTLLKLPCHGAPLHQHVLPRFCEWFSLFTGNIISLSQDLWNCMKKLQKNHFFHSTVTQCEKSLSEIFFSFAAAWAICFMNGKKATGKEKEVQV